MFSISEKSECWDSTYPVNAYCVFCKAGYEEKVAKAINAQNGLTAFPVMQEKHKSKNGVKSVVRQVMLPGYVFVYTNSPIPTKHVFSNTKVIYLLKYSDESYQLYGEDLAYAKWILKYNGLIACSTAVRLGSQVKIVEGPLKDYEGTIQEISKKNRNAKIVITIADRIFNIWLPFIWIE